MLSGENINISTKEKKKKKSNRQLLLSPLYSKALLGRCQSFFLHSLEGTTLINTPFSSALLPGFQAFSHSNKQVWMNFYLCEIVHSREAALEKMNTVYVAGCCGAVHPVTKRHQTPPFFMKDSVKAK